MERLRNGRIRYILWRLAGFVATLVVTALLLALFLSGTSTIDGFVGTLLFDFGVNGGRIAERLAVTLPLSLMALIVATLLGFAAGGYAAWKKTRAASAIVIVLRALLAAPPFWLGMVLLLVVASLLKLAPTGGFMPWQQNPGGAFASLILPAIALALPMSGFVAEATRRRLSDLVRSPLVFAAQVSGLTMREAVMRHGLLPALLPLVPWLFRRAGLLVAMSMIVENVFYLPGLGRLLFDAIAAHEAAMVRQVLFTLIAIGAALRLIGDLMLVAADPRVGSEVPA